MHVAYVDGFNYVCGGHTIEKLETLLNLIESKFPNVPRDQIKLEIRPHHEQNTLVISWKP